MSDAADSSKRYKGTVKWFSNRKGYGFVASAETPTEEEVFVHHSNIVSPEGTYRTLVRLYQLATVACYSLLARLLCRQETNTDARWKLLRALLERPFSHAFSC